MSESATKSPIMAFMALLFSMWVIMTVQTSGAPAYPSIVADLQFDAVYISWIASFNALASAVLAPVMGRYGDISGLKKAAIFGIAAFALGTFMLGLAPSLPVFLAGQFIQGVGLASSMPATMSFIGRCFPPDQIAKYFSVYSAGLTAGPIFGPLIATLFLSVEFLGWRMMYFFGGTLAVISVILIIVIVPKIAPLPQKASKFDVMGSIFMFISVGSFLLMPTLASLNGWFSPLVITLICLFVVFGIAFVVLETKKTNPLMDLKFVKTRTFGMPILIYIIFNAILSFIMYSLSTVVVFGLNQSAAVTGTIFAFMYVIMSVFSLIVGKLMSRFNWRNLAFVPIVSYLISIGIFATLTGESSLMMVYAACFFMGIACSFSTALFVTSALLDIPDESMRGSASGTFTMLGNLGGPIGVAILLPMLTSLAATPDGGMNYMSALPQVCIVMAVMVAICFIFAFFFPKYDPKSAATDASITTDEE